jgi:hypothetical protein
VTALCQSYDSHADARQAVQALLEAGIPGEGVRILMGEAERDAQMQAMGAFAGVAEAGAPMGRFADAAGADAGTGAFAGGPQRGGSFGDADRDVVTDYPAGVQRMRVAGHRRVRHLLRAAGLDEATAARDVHALHEGRLLVLVEVADGDAERARTLLAA